MRGDFTDESDFDVLVIVRQRKRDIVDKILSNCTAPVYATLRKFKKKFVKFHVFLSPLFYNELFFFIYSFNLPFVK